MKSSIQWLIDRIEDVDNTPQIWEQIKIQANKMHEKKILNAINIISKNNVMYVNKIINMLLKIENKEGELFTHNKKTAENYYNETFKK